MKIAMETGDGPTTTHCSTTSSYQMCRFARQYFNQEDKYCTAYRTKLEYDDEAHAYKRCYRCIDSEVKSN